MPFVRLVLLPKKPILLRGIEITHLHSVANNSTEWSASYQRAKLRVAIGLRPTEVTPILSVPVFTQKTLASIVGRELSVVVQYTKTGSSGHRAQVIDYLPKESPENHTDKEAEK